MESEDFLKQALIKRIENHNLRKLQVPDSSLIDFCSNDFLGFGRSEAIRNKVLDAFRSIDLPTYKPSSRLICGNHALYEELEIYLAQFHHAASGLIFNTGYMANLGVLSSIPQRRDTIIFDEQIHASARDGIRLSLANSFSFRHNDINDLEKKIQQAKGKIFVVVESVYSMDGDSPDIKALVSLKNKHGLYLIVDEAHSNGVVGDKGKGFCVDAGVEKDVFARIMTFGKAIGANGAIVLGSKILVEYLVNFARPFIYTTALATESLLRIKMAYQALEVFDFAHIKEIKHYFSLKFGELQHVNVKGSGLINSILVPGNEKVSQIAHQLRLIGFNIREVRSPTVAVGTERLRICLHQFNKMSEIDDLYDQLKKVLN